MRFTRQPNHRRYIFQSVFVLAWTIAAVRTCLCRSISISIGGLFFHLFVYYARFAWVRCSQSCVCVILRVRNQLRHKIDFDRTKIYRFNKYSKGFLKKWRSLPSNAFSAFIRLGSHNILYGTLELCATRLTCKSTEIGGLKTMSPQP